MMMGIGVDVDPLKFPARSGRPKVVVPQHAQQAFPAENLNQMLSFFNHVQLYGPKMVL